MNHSRKTGFMAAIQAASVALLVLLLVVLLDRLRLGVPGAIAALTVSGAFTATAGSLVAQRNYRILIPWGRVGLISGWLLGCGLVVQASRSRLGAGYLELVVHAGIFAVAVVVTLRLAGLRNLAQLLRAARRPAG
jgi:hypothetical protein